MRLPGFAEKFLFGTNRLLGIEIILQNESDFTINCCICERSGSGISMPFSRSGISSLDQFIEVIPEKDLPVSLVINGKGLIHKKISMGPQETVSTAFHKVFPTGNEHDFYTQLYYGLGEQGFVSVVRRKKVDEFIALFAEKGFTVIDLFLGPFVVEDTLVLNTSQSSVFDMEWEGHKVSGEDKKIREYSLASQNTSVEFRFGDLAIHSAILLCFSAAFHYFVPLARISHDNVQVLLNAAEYKNRGAFRKLTRVSVVFFLLVCLVNFFIFTNYFDKQKKLDAELTGFQNAISLHDKLSAELQNKKNFLDKSGLAFSTKTSYYADRLVYDIPEEIQLVSLSLFPLKKNIEKDSVIQFDTKKILIKGYCQKSILLNNWINLIKTKDFVIETVLDNYEQDAEMKNGKFDLTVRLR